MAYKYFHKKFATLVDNTTGIFKNEIITNTELAKEKHTHLF